MEWLEKLVFDLIYKIHSRSIIWDFKRHKKRRNKKKDAFKEISSLLV